MTDRTPTLTRPSGGIDPGWARTTGEQQRPYSLHEAAAAAGLFMSELPERLGIRGRVVEKLLSGGLTFHQATVVAQLLALDPWDVWGHYDEPLLRFVDRHENHRCMECAS